MHQLEKMEDRISNLPDEIVCHILSFLTTKEAVATSILSKRWKLMWRLVSTLDFDDANFRGSKKLYSSFVESVNSVILSRDSHLPIQKFRLFASDNSGVHDFTDISQWFDSAVQRRVEHIDISLCFWSPLNLCSIFSCKTLVVLKLQGLYLKPFSSSVDLPSLKVLHLQYLTLPQRGCLAELLNGCPVLEDLKVRYICFTVYEETGFEFKTVPKLVRADIPGLYSYSFLMKVVNNVQFLRINEIYSRFPHVDEGTGMFHNLTHIELVYATYNSAWFEVVRFLKYCPKLQVLVIKQTWFHRYDLDRICHNLKDWQDPSSVPKCILLNLKECYLNDYRGTKGEFQFAKYIMRNGRFLQRMTICSSTAGKEEEKLKNIQKLSSGMRCSATCKLSFK